MRSGQQNKRGRGRNNNNNNNNNNGRKGANPLTRTYDSSGPDVKIRGTAQHIAEKYAQLARDAQGSGDRVMAENYLQHAEHYNRIIAAAQAQMQERYQRDDRSDNSDHSDNEGSDGSDDANQTTGKDTSADNASDGSGPQPVIDGVPAEVALENEEQQNAPERPRRQQRQRRPRRQQNNAEGGEKQEGGSDSSGDSSGEPALAEAGE
ncbi:DUF4167 domain-containing protein [Rhizobium sp. L1K21]|uniref:DUF4167 domain-containing protein n=1 Tax=Rhizobium sp. L1K21 TaxID=2954933 RepID=UPI0020934DDC|nr:DUF4167 domain-containing protein [Rhizobium sp. L1K21]MCO6188213.1 DUF4167 domain-containing protein [Rhizobium sp. L1K21]